MRSNFLATFLISISHWALTKGPPAESPLSDEGCWSRSRSGMRMGLPCSPVSSHLIYVASLDIPHIAGGQKGGPSNRGLSDCRKTKGQRTHGQTQLEANRNRKANFNER